MATLNECTFHGNDAPSGGAIKLEASGININQCTFTTNTADAGGAIAKVGAGGGAIAIRSSTLTGNSASNTGGAIHAPLAGAWSIDNCIIVGNTAPVNPNFSMSPAPTQTGINITSGDPMLAPLGDYGGPTQTMPPLTNSPALDPAGGDTNSIFATDQRGFTRVVSVPTMPRMNSVSTMNSCLTWLIFETGSEVSMFRKP